MNPMKTAARLSRATRGLVALATSRRSGNTSQEPRFSGVGFARPRCSRQTIQSPRQINKFGQPVQALDISRGDGPKNDGDDDIENTSFVTPLNWMMTAPIDQSNILPHMNRTESDRGDGGANQVPINGYLNSLAAKPRCRLVPADGMSWEEIIDHPIGSIALFSNANGPLDFDTHCTAQLLCADRLRYEEYRIMNGSPAIPRPDARIMAIERGFVSIENYVHNTGYLPPPATTVCREVPRKFVDGSAAMRPNQPPFQWAIIDGEWGVVYESES